MDEAARFYGFEPNRAGFIRCPFHPGDNTASLKIYPDGRGWCCFGCHKGGTVIDFVKNLYDLDFRQALVRIDYDFHLGLIGTTPTAKESALLRQRQQEAAQRQQQLNEYNEHWERSIELTKQIDDLSSQVLDLLKEREQEDIWLAEHGEWDRKR